MSRSGSKKKAPRAPELQPWQERVLAAVSASTLAPELVFGGGAALSAIYLHHRTSDDVDFFSMRVVEPLELSDVAKALRNRSTNVEVEVVGPRTSLLLLKGDDPIGRVDFAYYPYDPVGRRKRWRDLTVDSLEDITVNKVQAVLTRMQARDFVDLYFLLREGPLRDLHHLLGLARAKFDVGPHDTGLAQRLLLVRDIRELPRMIRPVALSDLVDFFEERVREIVRAQ